MIDLYSAATPNGHMISIALEELGLRYTLHEVDLKNNEQDDPWFLAINPTGRIPAIIDRAEENFLVVESAAVLIYLAEKTGKLMPADLKGRSRVIQWLMFQMGGTDPVVGLGALDAHLKDSEYLAGDYSIADISNWAWVRMHKRSGATMDGFPNLQGWVKAIMSRPAVQRGLLMPPSSRDLEADLDEKMERFAAEGLTMLETKQPRNA